MSYSKFKTQWHLDVWKCILISIVLKLFLMLFFCCLFVVGRIQIPIPIFGRVVMINQYGKLLFGCVLRSDIDLHNNIYHKRNDRMPFTRISIGSIDIFYVSNCVLLESYWPWSRSVLCVSESPSSFGRN